MHFIVLSLDKHLNINEKEVIQNFIFLIMILGLGVCCSFWAKGGQWKSFSWTLTFVNECLIWDQSLNLVQIEWIHTMEVLLNPSNILN